MISTLEHKTFVLCSLILLCLLMSGCSQEVDLYLRADEQWELKTSQSLALDLIGQIGGEIEGISLDVDTGQIARQMMALGYNQITSTARARGMKASWSSHKNLGLEETVFVLRISGKGWDQLSSLIQPSDMSSLVQEGDIEDYLPVSIIVSSDEDGNLHFRMILPENMGTTGMIFPYTFRLHGAHIISANSSSINNGIAIWENPQGIIEAVVDPATNPSSWILPTVGGGVLLALASFIILHNRVHRNKKIIDDLGNYPIEFMDDYEHKPKRFWLWSKKN